MEILYKYSQFNVEIDDNSKGLLIYNTITHKTRYLDDEDKKLILNKSDIDPMDIMSEFIDEGFVVPMEKDELNSERPYRINHVDFEVTPLCNEKCIYCFNNWKDISNMSANSEQYIDLARKIIDIGAKKVLITGGEPLSVFDKIKDAIDIFIDNNIDISINSNGTLLTDEIAHYISERHIPMFISLPCADKTICDTLTGRKDSLEKISKSIKLARNYNIEVRINMVVTKLNIDYIFKTAEYVQKEFNIDKFSATKAMIPWDKPDVKELIITKEQFKYMLDELIRIKNTLGMEITSAFEYSLCAYESAEHIRQFAFKRKCLAGVRHICINWNGDVKPCSFNRKSYGNVYNESLSNIMKSMRQWRDYSIIPNECKQCKHFKYCGGGCRLDAENTYGDVKHLDSTANIENKDNNYNEYFKKFFMQHVKLK
jgi:radical SAM protein with 4Fe4S-binding SPASM domain